MLPAHTPKFTCPQYQRCMIFIFSYQFRTYQWAILQYMITTSVFKDKIFLGDFRDQAVWEIGNHGKTTGSQNSHLPELSKYAAQPNPWWQNNNFHLRSSLSADGISLATSGPPAFSWSASAAGLSTFHCLEAGTENENNKLENTRGDCNRSVPLTTIDRQHSPSLLTNTADH